MKIGIHCTGQEKDLYIRHGLVRALRSCLLAHNNQKLKITFRKSPDRRVKVSGAFRSAKCKILRDVLCEVPQFKLTARDRETLFA